jgi:tripartite-type tricarboxylate transporter receptor subunit TctC
MWRVLICGLAALASGWAVAQANPAPLRIIVPFAPGAGSDGMARFFGAELGKALNRTVVVENKTGAGGAIGADFVAKAPADGNTLLFIASPFTTVAAAGAAPKYEPAEFAPVAIMGYGPLLFVAPASAPGKDLRELMQYAQAHPNKLNYGSAGNGSINHLVVELLKQHTHTQLAHVPYRGIANATPDLLAGQIQLLTGSVPALMPFIKDGRLKALALTSKRRSSAVEGVPGMEEQGFKGFDVNNYWGLMAPPKTPTAIVQTLNSAVNSLLSQPEVAARLKADATEPTPMTLADIQQFIANDVKRWRELIERAQLKLD